MWVYFILLLYLAPGSLSAAMTYNGINGTSEFRIQQTSNTSLSFELKTRQSTASLLRTITVGTLNIGIDQGKLVITTSNLDPGITDTATINDGKYHSVYLVTETSPSTRTSLFVDRQPRQSTTSEMLTSAWRTEITETNIRVGEGAGIFYQGCLNGLVVGGESIDLSTANNSDGVSPNCTRSFDACTPDVTCSGRGTCQEDFNDFKCNCTDDFYKASKTCNETQNLTCQFKDNLCNNGTCRTLAIGSPPTVSQNGKDFFLCNCTAGYTGKVCQTDIDECKVEPCKNGSCIDQVNHYLCQCLPGFTGKNCDGDIDECAVSPCLNNMTCINGVNQYTCDCDGRYKGVNCSQDIDECVETANICTGRGNCTNTPGNFSCECTQGYFGLNCQYNNTQLCEKQEPCKNNGKCDSNMSGYNCTCKDSFTGKNCEISAAVKEDDNLPLIIGLSAAAAAIIIIVLLILLVRYCRDNSGMEGTYSPNKEEQAGGNVEMHAVKKPKTERLI